MHLLRRLLASRDPQAVNPMVFRVLLIVFDVVVVGSFVLLALVLATAVYASRKSNFRRSSAWYSFICAWMFYALAYGLLLGQQTGREPSYAFCVFQASLVLSVPPLGAWATFGLLFQLYVSIASLSGTHTVSHSKFWKVMRTLSNIGPLVAPPFFFAVSFAILLTFGLREPQFISRDASSMYCRSGESSSARIIYFVAIPAGVSSIVTEVLILIRLLKSRSVMKSLREKRLSKFGHGEVSLPMIFRASSFAIIPLIGMGIGAVFFNKASLISEPPSIGGSVRNVIVGILPLAAGLIVGIQRDIIAIWVKGPKAFNSTTSQPDTTRSLRSAKKETFMEP